MERRIDADVHVAAPEVAGLRSYLSAHWNDYLRDNGFRRPAGVAQSYPPKSAVMAEAGPHATVADIRDRVLSDSELAILNCYFGVEGVRHPYLSAALCSAINSWIAAAWLDKEPRLFGSILVPPHDTALAVEEIRRFGKDKRFVQVHLPARTWEPYGNRRYWPVYEAALEHDLAISVQFGGLTGMPPTPVGSYDTYFEEYSAATQLFGTHVLSLISEGVFEQFPKLRIVLVESGVTWLASWLWRLDTEWKGTRREIPWVQKLPSEYVKEHVRLTLEPYDGPGTAEHLAETIAHIDSGAMLLYSSDYPHRHLSSTKEFLEALAPEHRDRVLYSNAETFYGLATRRA